MERCGQLPEVMFMIIRNVICKPNATGKAAGSIKIKINAVPLPRRTGGRRI